MMVLIEQESHLSKKSKPTNTSGPVQTTQTQFFQEIHPPRPEKLKALNDAQQRYINAINTFPLTFGVGPAGSGKSFCATRMAIDALLDKDVDRIILTRPAVEAGENLGALPGELEEKYAPYIAPIREVLEETLGKSFTTYLIEKTDRIQPRPLAFLRGTTFKRSFVILDEAQNLTPTQMKLFLTRIGEDCTVVVNGDITQKDISGKSGLEDAIERLSFIPSIKVITFSNKDIVRSGLCQEIVEAYSQKFPKLD